MVSRKFINLLVLVSMLASLLLMSGGGQASAQGPTPPDRSSAIKRTKEKQSHRITNADRLAAAKRAAAKKTVAPNGKAVPDQTAAVAAAAAAPTQGGTPNYFGPESNWANSPLPTVDPTTGVATGGIRKFVDSLPGLGAAGANNLGQYIPVAVPDTTTYPGSDYYEIELGQYTEKMHSDLPPTTLRGYRQTNTATATSPVQLPGPADRRPEGPAGAHQVHQQAAHGRRRQPLPAGGHHGDGRRDGPAGDDDHRRATR